MRFNVSPDPAVCGELRGGVRVGVLTLALAMLLAAAATAQTFYVDNQSPNASPAGPGSEEFPYSTISRAVADRSGPGSTIMVKPGVYREQVVVPASGVDGHPFVIQAAGPGVVIDGADLFNDEALWVQGTEIPAGGSHGLMYLADEAWLAPSVNWNVQQVFVDGVRLQRSTQPPGNLPVNAFHWMPGFGLFVNLGGGNPGTRMIQVGKRANGFRLAAKSWVTIDGFEITRMEDRGISIQTGCTDLVLSNNRVSFVNDYGIKTINSARLTIDGNTVSDCNLHGIGLTAGTNGCVVRNNESCRNADPAARTAKGIYLFLAPDNTLIGNRVHDNQDSGVNFGGGSNNCISYNNRSWNNGDHGYDHLNASGTIHVNDVAFGNWKDGFSIEGSSPYTQLFNCIAVDNGLPTDEFNLWINGPSTPGFVSDYNIFWNSTAQPPIKHVATKFATLSGYQLASGQDAHSIQSDPMFVNAAAGDFMPMSGSPAIDAGTSDVAHWPSTDALGNGRFDDLATPDVGSGPVTYSDIGAFEFVAVGPAAPPASLRPVASMGRPGRLPLSVASTSPTSFALSQGFPNPSRGPVEFALDLPAESDVTWEVFDLQGRMVWSEHRSLPAGRTRMAWDGRSSGGNDAGTGVYLVRAQVAGQRFTRRVVRF